MKKMLQYILFSILNPQGQKTWTVHFRARRDTNSTIISESDLEQLFEHGCHCHKLDQEKNEISNIGSGAVLDEMDSICRDWLNARKCITYAGGSCFALAGEDSYQLQINTQTNELDCSLNSGASQCVQDACYIDAQYAGFILGEIQNNYENTGFVAIQGDNVSCPNNVGLLAPVGCSGVAPNVEIIRELP